MARKSPLRLGIRPLLADELTFVVEYLPETDVSPDDHCAHEGCEGCCTWVREQLAAGNEWAWCTIRVAARWQGFAADDLLGCCSYASEEQFRQPGGYFEDMKVTALHRLNAAVTAANQRLAHLREEIPSIGSDRS